MTSADRRCPRCDAGVSAQTRFCSSCGASMPLLEPGETLDGKYEILDKIAEGGMGELYRARHVHLDEIRAIKVTKPGAFGEGAEPRRFQEEARTATRVRHPNVATLYDFSRREDGSYYMVWEFIEGVTLQRWLRDHGAMPIAQALDVAKQVLAGLQEIHAQGIVHRDLSPDNIMIREGPGGRLHAKIIDLGIAKRLAAQSAAMTQSGMFVGKLQYCSPEQAGALAAGETIDGRSDLYSFAVVLYEMICGRPAFVAQTPEEYLGKHLHKPPPPLDISGLPPEIGPPLAGIIARALAKSRGQRFSDAADFAEALARLPVPGAAAIVERNITAPAPPIRPRLSAPASSPAPTRRIGSLALVALLLAAAIAAFYVARTRGGEPAARATPPAPTAIPSPQVPPDPAAVPAAFAPTSTARENEAPTPTAVSTLPTKGPARIARPPAKAPESSPVRVPPSQPDAAAAAAHPKQRLRGWLARPLPERARRAAEIARWANELVSREPENPAVKQLQHDLPRMLKGEALSALDGGRPRLAQLFYRAYSALSFAPADAELERRFQHIAPPEPPKP